MSSHPSTIVSDDTPSAGLARRSSVQMHNIMSTHSASYRTPDYYRPLDQASSATYGIRPLKHGTLKLDKYPVPLFEASGDRPGHELSNAVAGGGHTHSSPHPEQLSPVDGSNRDADTAVAEHKSAFYKNPKFIVSPPSPPGPLPPLPPSTKMCASAVLNVATCRSRKATGSLRARIRSDTGSKGFLSPTTSRVHRDQTPQFKVNTPDQISAGKTTLRLFKDIWVCPPIGISRNPA